MATVYLGSDHAGVRLKTDLMARLVELGHNPQDLGPQSDASCDYPVYAKSVCDKVLADDGSFGILICGTGIGMSMAANRVPGIRAALCGCEMQARFCRRHNNANVLCLGARVTGPGLALAITDDFMSAEFEGGRHLKRVNLFDK